MPIQRLISIAVITAVFISSVTCAHAADSGDTSSGPTGWGKDAVQDGSHRDGSDEDGSHGDGSGQHGPGGEHPQRIVWGSGFRLFLELAFGRVDTEILGGGLIGLSVGQRLTVRTKSIIHPTVDAAVGLAGGRIGLGGIAMLDFDRPWIHGDVDFDTGESSAGFNVALGLRAVLVQRWSGNQPRNPIFHGLERDKH